MKIFISTMVVGNYTHTYMGGPTSLVVHLHTLPTLCTLTIIFSLFFIYYNLFKAKHSVAHAYCIYLTYSTYVCIYIQCLLSVITTALNKNFRFWLKGNREIISILLSFNLVYGFLCSIVFFYFLFFTLYIMLFC